jgi:hypothetical protein
MRGYITLREMAERLGYKNGNGLRSQIRFGALHAEKLGRDWVVSEQEYARYVLEHAGKPGRKKKVETS